VVSYELIDSPVERETKSKQAVITKAKNFHVMIENVISREISEPLIAGNYFTFRLCQEFQLKGIGYHKLDELCLFKVKDGKIIYEEYFYSGMYYSFLKKK
jgi:hypothetical protein